MGQNSCLALVQGVLGGSLGSNLELDGDEMIKMINHFKNEENYVV